MYIMNDFQCKDRIRLGFILRLIATIIVLFYLKYYESENSKNMIILIVVKLVLLDLIHGIPTLFYREKNSSCWNPCTYFNTYQIPDKIIDLLTYFMVYILFDYDPYLLILIVWRFFGVYMFANSQKREWLIPFFDFVKEYLIYLFFFGYNFKYIWVFFCFKIAIEYYQHHYRLLHNRCLNNSIRS